MCASLISIFTINKSSLPNGFLRKYSTPVRPIFLVISISLFFYCPLSFKRSLFTLFAIFIFFLLHCNARIYVRIDTHACVPSWKTRDIRVRQNNNTHCLIVCGATPVRKELQCCKSFCNGDCSKWWRLQYGMQHCVVIEGPVYVVLLYLFGYKHFQRHESPLTASF